MTDKELLGLYDERCRAWSALGARPHVYLHDPSTEAARAFWRKMDNHSARYRAANAAIVAELLARDKPAQLPGVTLHLTADRLAFVALRPGTLIPRAWGELYTENDRHMARGMESYLYDYDGTSRRRAGVSA